MGKSTTAEFFAQAGAAVWDADAAVHRLYSSDGPAVDAIRAICPESIINGKVDRTVLKNWIAADPDALRQIEAIVHPLVALDRTEFAQSAQSDIVVFDIPLLFENNLGAEFDLIVVVSTTAEKQRERVLQRPGMTEAQFDLMRGRQLSDSEKRQRADLVISTDTLESTKTAVQRLIADIRKGRANA